MKKFPIAFALILTLALIAYALRGWLPKQHSEPEPAAQHFNTDTLEADELEEIIAEAPMPKVAEELFDDFFFNFAISRSLQPSRIAFPLSVTDINRQRSTIAKDEWQYEHFFIFQDCYTLIFDNYKQMQAPKDTTVNRATVEKITFDNNQVAQYYFERRAGQWMMTYIKILDIANHPNASFLEFYNQFSTDVDFQMESLADPLTFVAPDPDDELSTIEGMLLPEQWPSFAPPLPSGTIYNIIYGEPMPSSNRKILLIQGISNGFQTEIEFQRKQTRWITVRLQV